MRLLPKPEQRPNIPRSTDDYREEVKLAAEYNVLYFLECLGRDRNTHFSDLGQPDVLNRNMPSPDRLARNDNTRQLIAIEYAELRNSEAMPSIRTISEQVGWAAVPSLAGEDLANKLIEAIERKREKQQFARYSSAEKVLLFKDWVSVGHRFKDFEKCSEYFKTPKESGCDHCYVLLRENGLVIELF